MNRLRAALILLVLLAVAGCSQAHGHAAAVPLPLPLDGAGYPSAATAATLHVTEEKAVARCMHDRGFVYRIEPSAGQQPANPYDLLSTSDAAHFGYGLTRGAARAAAPDPDAPVLAALSKDRRAAWTAALLGTAPHRTQITEPGMGTFFYDPNGCVARADAAVYGPSWRKDSFDLESLDARVVHAVLTSPSFLAGQHRWAACMQRVHITAATLPAARAPAEALLTSYQNGKAALGTVARTELRDALADTGCQQQVGLAGIVTHAQHIAENQLPAGWQRTASAVKDMRTQALAAGSTVSGGL